MELEFIDSALQEKWPGIEVERKIDELIEEAKRLADVESRIAANRIGRIMNEDGHLSIDDRLTNELLRNYVGVKNDILERRFSPIFGAYYSSFNKDPNVFKNYIKFELLASNVENLDMRMLEMQESLCELIFAENQLTLLDKTNGFSKDEQLLPNWRGLDLKLIKRLEMEIEILKSMDLSKKEWDHDIPFTFGGVGAIILMRFLKGKMIIGDDVVSYSFVNMLKESGSKAIRLKTTKGSVNASDLGYLLYRMKKFFMSETMTYNAYVEKTFYIDSFKSQIFFVQSKKNRSRSIELDLSLTEKERKEKDNFDKYVRANYSNEGLSIDYKKDIKKLMKLLKKLNKLTFTED